ncbi:unnamed protein product [Cuscuta campestris]|uniref:Uncharacterized protein n=1 Tax=Cuscuta campestris TaxID=132261 RepID=A0A484LZN6_9ASTE|nr:unnamed protein product [Cuscuta campestris]
MVKLIDIELTVETLGRVVRLPYQGGGISTYGNDEWLINNEELVIDELGITELIRHAAGHPMIHCAAPESQLLLYNITRILKPWDGSHTTMFGKHLKVIHAIMHGAPINWPNPVTRATKVWVIDNQIFKKKPDTGATTTRHTTTPRHAATPARATLTSIAYSTNRLSLTVDGMGSLIERIDVAVQRRGYVMQAYSERVNNVPPPYQSTFLGQDFVEDENNDSYAPLSSPDDEELDEEVGGDPLNDKDDEEKDEEEDEDEG